MFNALKFFSKWRMEYNCWYGPVHIVAVGSNRKWVEWERIKERFEIREDTYGHPLTEDMTSLEGNWRHGHGDMANCQADWLGRGARKSFSKVLLIVAQQPSRALACAFFLPFAKPLFPLSHERKIFAIHPLPHLSLVTGKKKRK